MKKLLLLALVALGVSIAAQEGPPNTLTAQEKSAGWKLLFDGTTLNNFVPQGKAQWKIVDGAVRAEGAGGWLATKDDYANFQLQVDFRTSAPDINSGIYIRRARQDGDSHQIGYELQIRNPSPGDKPYDGKTDNHNAYYTGSFSGHLKSKNEPTVIMGKWHHFDLTAQGITSSTTVTSVVFLFGTGPDSTLPGTLVQAVPAPAIGRGPLPLLGNQVGR